MTRVMYLTLEESSDQLETFLVAMSMYSWTGDVLTVMDEWIRNANLTDCKAVGSDALELIVRIRDEVEELSDMTMARLAEIGSVADIVDPEPEATDCIVVKGAE